MVACAELVHEEQKVYMGMENAYDCLPLDGNPFQAAQRLADTSCGDPDSSGHRLGGPSAVALYRFGPAINLNCEVLRLELTTRHARVPPAQQHALPALPQIWVATTTTRVR